MLSTPNPDCPGWNFVWEPLVLWCICDQVPLWSYLRQNSVHVLISCHVGFNSYNHRAFNKKWAFCHAQTSPVKKTPSLQLFLHLSLPFLSQTSWKKCQHVLPPFLHTWPDCNLLSVPHARLPKHLSPAPALAPSGLLQHAGTASHTTDPPPFSSPTSLPSLHSLSTPSFCSLPVLLMVLGALSPLILQTLVALLTPLVGESRGWRGLHRSGE